MNSIKEGNIVVVNLETVTDVFVWGGHLAACMAGANGQLNIGDIAVAVRGSTIVASGRVTKRSLWVTDSYDARGNGNVFKVWVRMNLYPAAVPVALSARQKSVLKVTAQQYGCAYPGFEDVLAIPVAELRHFTSILALGGVEKAVMSSQHKDKQEARLLDIIDRTDLNNEHRVALCNALYNRGSLSDLIYNRDEHRSETDHELDWAATRIVPWDACTDFERTDPNNYILLDEQLADHFAMGLISFRDNGKQIQDPAMDKDAWDPWVDSDFNLPTLTKEQKKYMSYHRAHVFKHWRAGLSKPMYVRG